MPASAARPRLTPAPKPRFRPGCTIARSAAQALVGEVRSERGGDAPRGAVLDDDDRGGPVVEE